MLTTRSRRLRLASLGLALLSTTTVGSITDLAAPDVALAETGTTRSYTASAAAIANPDRGMYRYTGTHYRADGSGHVPLDEAQLRQWRTAEGVTLAYRIFYLEKFAGQDLVDAAYLRLVEQDFEVARRAGVKLVVRFAYSEDSSRDAPAARVRGHIWQLAPVLNRSADVIATLQAGFVGQWGEWYYSDNFASDPSRPWLLSDADWAARGSVLRALLDATDSRLLVQVRYPEIKQRLVPPTDPRAGRVGIHNDCFLASEDDWGTFRQSGDRAWLAEQTRTVPMGGETCNVSAPRSLWPSASADLAAYHWSYLNADFHKGVLDSWGPESRSEAARRLGYRLRLSEGVFPASASAAQTFAMTLTLTNDGYAAPFRDRPVRLVMRGPAGTHVADLPVDVRTLAPGAAVRLPLTVAAPSEPGTYSLRLALPDASPRLAADPAYSVQLANVGTWDASRGENDLQQSLRVDPAPAGSAPAPTPAPASAPGPSPAPAAVRLSSLPATGVTNGWGPMEVDRSNGEQAAGDGRRLSLRGQVFDHGLGVHADSSARFALGGAYRSLRATLGVDDETAGAGSVVFEVYGDGALRYRSPVLTGRSAPLPVSVEVTGVKDLRLAVTGAGDGIAYDHADWAAAELR